MKRRISIIIAAGGILAAFSSMALSVDTTGTVSKDGDTFIVRTDKETAVTPVSDDIFRDNHSFRADKVIYPQIPICNINAIFFSQLFYISG